MLFVTEVKNKWKSSTSSSKAQQKNKELIFPPDFCRNGDAESNYILHGLNNAENELFVSFLKQQRVLHHKLPQLDPKGNCC